MSIYQVTKSFRVRRTAPTNKVYDFAGSSTLLECSRTMDLFPNSSKSVFGYVESGARMLTYI
ncbi:MAG: hypothetical protein LBF72_02745 [Holosporales bacterium]|nr:hypothetical protein [Holosporales bacterium]